MIEQPASAKRRILTRLAAIAAGLAIAYLAVAYLLMPLILNRYFHKHPALNDLPGVTTAADDVPGDPINVALIGTEDQLKAVLKAAGWSPADALGLRSDLRIAEATVLKKEYNEAPVSNLYLWGRKEDLAYEQPVGPDPRQRHHVRFWRSEKLDPDGRPVWMGSATFDERVGLSHRTGQITHHIAADVDQERDHLLGDLEKTGALSERYTVDGFHKIRSGRNGGGDPWQTDGNLYVGVLVAGRSTSTAGN